MSRDRGENTVPKSPGRNSVVPHNGGAKRQVDVTLAEGVFSCLGRHFDDPVLADVVVKVEDRAFFCHRIFLCACSEVFRARLHTDTSNGIPTEVTVDGMSADTLKLVLTIIYKGCNVITRENVVDIWSAAHLLRIAFLWRACESVVLKEISSKNMVRFYECGKRLNSRPVINVIIDIMSQTFFEFAKSDSFLSISEHVLQTVLTSPHLRASVDEVVAAIMRWINWREQQFGNGARSGGQGTEHHQRESGSTQKLFGNLLKHVDLENVSDPSLALLLKNMSDAAPLRDSHVYVNLLRKVEYRLNVNEYENVDNKVSIHTKIPVTKTPIKPPAQPRPPALPKQTSSKHARKNKLHNGTLSTSKKAFWSSTPSLISPASPPPCGPLSVISSNESIPSSLPPSPHSPTSLPSNPSPFFPPFTPSSALLCSKEKFSSPPASPGTCQNEGLSSSKRLSRSCDQLSVDSSPVHRPRHSGDKKKKKANNNKK